MVFKIALLQLLPETSLEEQFKIGKAACEEAKNMGADIALFPEMWSNGYSIPQSPLTVILCRDSAIWRQNFRWQLLLHFLRSTTRNR